MKNSNIDEDFRKQVTQIIIGLIADIADKTGKDAIIVQKNLATDLLSILVKSTDSHEDIIKFVSEIVEEVIEKSDMSIKDLEIQGVLEDER